MRYSLVVRVLTNSFTTPMLLLPRVVLVRSLTLRVPKVIKLSWIKLLLVRSRFGLP
ncbi:hypothetical protein LC653_39025 [Nostoc sp. CHAB 5784]|uniref:hypothetical protein n=1 Tax=Nostoc mirabile TaxID=2907820 RepID=UPI001E463F6C|nr:hypothetical protein [Nostoc mirabile]MCC5669646.1 hypothetical protein [Nostoc mirabile CHAB5784]